MHSNDASLLSFERHEVSAGNATLMTTNDQDELKSNENNSPIISTNADWSYFVTVREGLSRELEKPSPATSSGSSSSCSSLSNNDTGHSEQRRHVGGLEFFISGDQQDSSARKS